TIKDIVQECFVQLWEDRSTLCVTSIQAYLFTMVRNRCLNYLKHLIVIEGYKEKMMAENKSEEMLYHVNFMHRPDGKILLEELYEEIDHTIENLPPRTREAFTMSRIAGLKNREIADRLGISVKVVEKHISRTLQALRKKFPAYIKGIMAFLLFL
ncbi:MAG TPA: RNA polymerase sigma-70 factor, partial [Prevotella sp.]